MRVEGGPAQADFQAFVETLNRGLSEDMFSEYIASLETEIGVSINQSALSQVTSGGAGGDVN